MKTSTLTMKLVVAALCVAVLLYFSLNFLLSFRDDLVTTTAYSYSVNVGASATGLIVRQEELVTGEGQYLDVQLAEGERVGKNGVIAQIYSDLSALETRQSIEALEAEIEQLEYALAVGTQGINPNKVESQVISSIVSLRQMIASGDLSNLEDNALNLRTMIFQQEYLYGDSQTATNITQLINEKRTQLTSLTSSLGQVSQSILATNPGVFSGEVDGYESTLTPELLSTLTLQGLEELLEQPTPQAPTALGKLITSSTWYFAAHIPQVNLGLQEGKTYQISFSHDYYGTIPMELERMEIGEEATMAIFSCNTHLSDTTLLREQTVEVVVQELEGIRIPRQALRVETETETQEDGTQKEVNTYGVWTVVGTQAEWQEVKILYSDPAFYLVEPVDPQASARLRAGDEVILKMANLFSGKVVRG